MKDLSARMERGTWSGKGAGHTEKRMKVWKIIGIVIAAVLACAILFVVIAVIGFGGGILSQGWDVSPRDVEVLRCMDDAAPRFRRIRPFPVTLARGCGNR